jgi:hypothetical protein
MDRTGTLKNLYIPAKIARRIIAEGVNNIFGTSLSIAVYQVLSQTYESVKADARLGGQLSDVISTEFEAAVDRLRVQVIKREDYWQSLGEQTEYYTLVSLLQSVGHLLEELQILTSEKKAISSRKSPLLTTREWKQFVSCNTKARKALDDILHKLTKADDIIYAYRQRSAKYSSYLDTEVSLLDTKISDLWLQLNGVLAEFA